MKNIVELKKDVYYVGSTDWNVRNFHGYTTNKGSTYGAYLIIDEKITLIDTVKKPFAQDFIDRISSIVDPSKIDYLISNHVEMDHSGAIPDVMKVMPNATIVTVGMNGLKGLQAHYGDKYKYQTVKTGDILNIGKRNLTFVSTPMLHWPDNMVTYCPEEKILFSNDAYGQHFASSGHFDDEVDIDVVYKEAKKYYANILMPYGSQAKKAIEITKGLDIDIIAPSHGVIWRKNVKSIIELYEKWSGEPNAKEAVVVYDSMWHSTEIMANEIAELIASKNISVQMFDLKENHISDIMTSILTAKYIFVGSPTLNNNMLPTVAGFLTYLKGLTTKNKVGVAFGSYGWGGQSVGQVQNILSECGYEMPLEPLKINYIPTEKALTDITEKIKTIL